MVFVMIRSAVRELRALWRMYARYYRGQMRSVQLSLVGSLASSLLSVPLALLARRAVDTEFSHGTTGGLLIVAGAMAAVHFTRLGLAIVVQRVSTRLNNEASATLRKELLGRLHELPRSFLTAQEPAEIQSLIVADTARVADFSSSMINALIPSAITVIALSTYLLVLNPILGLIMVATAPAAMIVNHRLRGQVQTRATAYRMSFWRFNGAVHRAIRIWDLTSAQNAVSEEIADVHEAVDELTAANRAQQAVANVYSQVQALTVSLAGVLVLLVGGLEIQSGKITVGTFLSFFVAMALAQSATQSLLGALPGILIGREALLSLQSWTDADHSAPYQGTATPRLSGGMRFEHVSFSYGDVEVLRDINLDIDAGNIIALIGPNGAGKTTMMNLLMGWYRPSAGRLLADDVPFDELSIRAWRDSIALVHQDPLFLNATVRNNIRYGRPDTTDDEIWRAARLAAADDVICSLPQGLDTPIGEGGVLLSGGQRQRLALTRALVRNPRILVMDEPTNHLDRPAVRRLIGQLMRLPQRPTVIVITHDTDVLEIASRTYRIANGRIEERPTITARAV